MEQPHPVPTTRPTDRQAADPRAGWRREVGELRVREQRRRHPLGVHVGEPAGRRESLELPWPEPGWYDSGLRVDLVTALLARPGARVGSAACWLTRPGVPDLHDADLAWYAAALRGFGAQDVTLTGFYAVTRSGWLEVATGDRRAWKRLRLGPGARGARRPRRSGAGQASGPEG